ncbi:MAG: aminotransferase class III-fold pyridoxal phosphate-dependent enzyme, partial [Syntrophothermus sp.]
KKMQICGIMANSRIDEVEDNCFAKSSRINSTWGGNLVDMIRSKRNLEIIDEENLVENAEVNGRFLLENLIQLQEEYPEFISNARGLGLMCAFDMPDVELRKTFVEQCYKNKLLILPCGKNSIRFRPVLDITNHELNEGLKIIEKILYLMR